MLFKCLIIVFSLTTVTNCQLVSNKFCDKSLMNGKLIDKMFQTLTSVYIIRDSMVYPMIKKELPRVDWDGKVWQQKREEFPIKDLFIGIISTINNFNHRHIYQINIPPNRC